MTIDDGEAELLIKTLNKLLEKLIIPFTLHTLSDLVPSLLLAVLESVLRERLPISTTIRESKTPSSRLAAMKIFLGVLAGDILATKGFDESVIVEISEIDPKRLAAGEEDECFMVGEVLCRLGVEFGYLEHGQQKDGNFIKAEEQGTPTRSSTPESDLFQDSNLRDDTRKSKLSKPRTPSPFTLGLTGGMPPRPSSRVSVGPSPLSREASIPSPRMERMPPRVHRSLTPSPPPSAPPAKSASTRRKSVCIHEVQITPPSSPPIGLRTLSLNEPMSRSTSQSSRGTEREFREKAYHETFNGLNESASTSASVTNSSHLQFQSYCTCEASLYSEDTSLYCTCAGHRAPSPETPTRILPAELTTSSRRRSSPSSDEERPIYDRTVYADTTRVRFDGEIQYVPPEKDYEEYQRARNKVKGSSNRTRSSLRSSDTFNPSSSPSKQTLALMNERARLYAELAKVRYSTS